MAGEAHNSQAIMTAARRSLAEQRAGGRRLAPSIGRGSAALKKRHLVRKVGRMLAAVAAIVVASMAAGLFISGIGLEGLFLTVLAIAAAVYLFGRYPRLKAPEQGRLNEGDAQTMVARTELWLENQRPALPAPAIEIVDRLGVQLDALGVQLQGVAEQPATIEVRKLVGEHLPEMISTYRRIPAHLRREERGDGRTPDQQLSDGLNKISGEIDAITRQLAAGDLDNLAVRGRFLDYKYSEGLEESSKPEASE